MQHHYPTRQGFLLYLKHKAFIVQDEDDECYRTVDTRVLLRPKLLLSKTMTSHRLKMWKLHCPRRMFFLGFKLWNSFPNLSHESTDSKFFSPNFLGFEIFIPTQEASNGTWNPEIWPPSYWRKCNFSLRYYKVIEIIGVWLINIGRV